MNHKGFLKGMAMGMVAGAAIGMIATPKSKNAKKAAGRVLRAAGDVVENISSLWS